MLAVLSAWSALALWLDMRSGAAPVVSLVFAVMSVALLSKPRAPARPLALLILNVLVLGWWLHLKPDPRQDWAPEFARTPWAELRGDQVVIHDVRNFSYRTEKEFTEDWEIRTIDLRQVEGADVYLTHWGVPLVAHSMVSFRFGDGTYLATSIEARRTRTEDFSAFRGFFRRFQVSYLIGDERDLVRVRTNYRHGENAYLYRTRLTPADARSLLAAYCGWMNCARAAPQWYNAVTRNCATPIVSFLAEAHIGGISRWDPRGVLGGGGDRMLYRLGDLADGGLPFEKLKAQAFINPAARGADGAPDFSARIRAGRAGFGP